MLFTVGGCGIWWIIDFLILITGNFQDDDEHPDVTISVLEGGNEFGKTAAKCHYSIMNSYLALGNLEKAKENAAALENFPNTYIEIDGEKKLFYKLVVQFHPDLLQYLFSIIISKKW